MKKTVYLIVNSRTGDCRLRQTPAAGPMEYLFQLNLEMPDQPIPTVTINIPVPAAPAVITEVGNIPFGINWAIAEGLVTVNGLDNDGKVILDWTETGLERLYREAKGDKETIELFDAYEYSRRTWGLSGYNLFIDRDRWETIAKRLSEGDR